MYDLELATDLGEALSHGLGWGIVLAVFVHLIGFIVAQIRWFHD